jgi:hypothetical protein
MTTLLIPDKKKIEQYKKNLEKLGAKAVGENVKNK